ncbi:MAG: YceI family protein [bacterium]|jgi:hypothetical protein
MKFLKLLFLGMLLSNIAVSQTVNKWLLKQGNISFKSEAPLELIQAKSTELKGLILSTDLTYAFTVNNSSFKGFNSALQEEHFNENYMESNKFPRSTFKGKIVDPIDFSKDGKYEVRAKGKLQIHGIEKDRIIKSVVEVKGNMLIITSKFTVLLEDYDISIPKVVHQKIAEEINIEVKATFEK